MLTPARDLDVLDLVERVRPDPGPGRRRPGWRVTVETPGRTLDRLFRDADHGSPYDALRAAVEWRDAAVSRTNKSARAVRPPQADGSLGVRLRTSTTRGNEYPVAVADLPATGDAPRTKRVRSVDRYGPVEALRQCAAFRFEGMKARYGDAYPYATADDLLADVLAAEGLSE